MSRRSLAAPAASTLLVAVVLALTGCGAPATGTGTDPAEESGASGSTGGEADTTPTSCVSGSWSADVDDLVEQLAAQLEESGMQIVTSRSAGTQTLTITDDGDIRFDNDVVFAIDVQLNDAVMTVAQNHTGAMTANWAWLADAESATMVLEHFDDSSYAIENTVAVDGVSSTTPIELPPMSAGDGKLLVTCSGSTLTTQPEAAPFVTRWTR